MLIDLVQDHVPLGIALQLQDDAQALTVAFVTQVGDTLDHPLAHHLGDSLQQPGLGQLIGNLGDYDGFAVSGLLLHAGPTAHYDGAAALAIGREDAGATDHDTAGRKVRSRHEAHQVLDRGVGIVQ